MVYRYEAVIHLVPERDGSVCCVIGMLKAIRGQLGKTEGDMVAVTVERR